MSSCGDGGGGGYFRGRAVGQHVGRTGRQHHHSLRGMACRLEFQESIDSFLPKETDLLFVQRSGIAAPRRDRAGLGPCFAAIAAAAASRRRLTQANNSCTI